MSALSEYSFTAELYLLEDGARVIALKIQGAAFELNVRLKSAELAILREVPAFWSCDDNSVSVCIGPDDESWDFAVLIPLHEFPRLMEAIEGAPL